MNLHRLLQKKKSAIRKRWLDEIFTSYPPDACHFLKDEMDVFANPVGHTISANADYIL